MTRRHLVSLILAAAAAATLSAAAAPPSTTAEIDALLEAANARFEVAAEDAVILFEGHNQEWTADGRQLHSLHRIVLIRSEHAIDSYADLRVPWDSSRQRLEVHALRSFRLSDRRWTESGPTAVVETLPFAVGRAPDYAHLRETMLLHDGVELPCVLETAYTVEDSEPFRGGFAGVHGFAGHDPTLRARLVLAAPTGSVLELAPAGGVGEPARGIDGARGLDTLSFELGPLDALPAPATAEPAATAPQLAWSSWGGWSELGAAVVARLDAGDAVDEALRAALDEALAAARSAGERAEKVAGLVAESTRYVDYQPARLNPPRPAHRSWATAYAHQTDRVVLAAALLGAAGLNADPLYYGPGFAAVDPRAATIAALDGPLLWVNGDGVEGVLDPATGVFTAGPPALTGRALWHPGLDDAPLPPWRPEQPSRCQLRLDLRFDAETGRFSGHGLLRATGVVSPYGAMQGLDPERSLIFVDKLVAGVLDGATVSAVNPAAFDPAAVTVGFAVELPAPERDLQGRLRLEVGDPGAALHSPLAGELGLTEQHRASALYLPGAIQQQVELHLEHGGLETVYLPAPVSIDNAAGSFELVSRDSGDKLVVVRTIRLDRERYDPDLWSQLRQILIADHHRRSRTLLLK